LLKKIFAILLLFAFTLQCFSNFLIVIGFYANQKYIAATICENRYKPMLHCNGKCILAKKLRQEEKKNSQDPERKPDIKNEIISSRSFFASHPFVPTSISYKLIPRVADLPTDHYTEIFHPPSA
jgi:hypothetical protein